VIRPEPPAEPSPTAIPTAAPAARSPDTELLAVLDVALRVIGGLVAVVAAVVTAVLELLFAYLRLAGPFAGLLGSRDRPLVGVSVVLAVVANAALAWFAYRAVGRVWAVALPAVAWLAVMFVAADRTAAGDILLINWVGVLMIFAGSMAFAVMAFRLILAGGERLRVDHQRRGG